MTPQDEESGFTFGDLKFKSVFFFRWSYIALFICPQCLDGCVCVVHTDGTMVSGGFLVWIPTDLVLLTQCELLMIKNIVKTIEFESTRERIYFEKLF